MSTRHADGHGWPPEIGADDWAKLDVKQLAEFIRKKGWPEDTWVGEHWVSLLKGLECEEKSKEQIVDAIMQKLGSAQVYFLYVTFVLFFDYSKLYSKNMFYIFSAFFKIVRKVSFCSFF